MDSNLLRHGIKREAYAVPLATNWKQMLLGFDNEPEGTNNTCFDIGVAAVKRWVIPRAERCLDWVDWKRTDTWQDLFKYNSGVTNQDSEADDTE
jgi:hypothetical protein